LATIASLAVPSLALAAGLGKLSVLSTLGQPLKAEIEIVSLQKGEGDSLGARLAPIETFRQANVDLNPALLSVKFAVERSPSGQYVMSLTSTQPVNEPFVDVLVELNWSNGRLVREYTFLLDPPEYAGPKKGGSARAAAPTPAPLAPAEPATPQPAAPEAPVQAQAAEPVAILAAVPLGPNVPGQSAPADNNSVGSTSVVAAVPSPAPAEPAAAEPQVQVMPVGARGEPERAQVDAAPAPADLAQEPGVKGSYEVVRGDTLSKIAMRNPVEGVSLQQMLVALFRANPDAFVADNMNRLSAGKIVNIPDRDAAESVAPADARRIVSAQYADFNDYRRSLGVAVASSSAPQGGARQASGPITAPKEEKPAPKEPPKDELRLSRGDEAKRGGKAGTAAAGDDLAAKDNALKEANERIALLQKNVQDLQNLVEVKNKAAAQLQQQAEAAKADAAKAAALAKAEPAKAPEPAKIAPKAPEAAKATEAPKAPEPAKAPAQVVAKAPEPAKAPEAPKAPEAAKAPEAPKAPEAAKAPEAPKPPEPAKTDSAKAAPKPAPKKAAQQPAVEVSFLDDLMDNPVALGGAGGAVLLLAGYAVFKWRRKRSSQFENSIMSVVPSDADSVLGSVGGRNVDTSSSSIQSDFGAGASKAAGEEIDPIAEADVYMAYGRDAQAEEILKDALGKDSSRQPIRVKLLEIYANRKDTRAFENAANELRSATGGRGPDWDKVAALGLSIDPGNPLYGGKPGSAAPAASASQLPAGFNETAQMPAFNPPTTTGPTIGAEAPLNIDFDIGASTQAGPAPLPDLDLGIASTPSAAPAGLDFDLGLGGGDRAAASAAGAAPAAEPALSIDFNLPMGDQPGAPAQATTPVAVPALELGAIDFDLGTKPAASEPKAASLDLGSISLDLGTPAAGSGNGSGGAPDARWQEVATKLDLAKAYEEMGDKDGARELLKEVVKEGDTAQQQQAQTMLQALS